MRSTVNAVLGGVVDPIAYLRISLEEWDVACVVMEGVLEARATDRKSELTSIVKAIGESVGNQVANQIGRMFSG